MILDSYTFRIGRQVFEVKAERTSGGLEYLEVRCLDGLLSIVPNCGNVVLISAVDLQTRRPLR